MGNANKLSPKAFGNKVIDRFIENITDNVFLYIKNE